MKSEDIVLLDKDIEFKRELLKIHSKNCTECHEEKETSFAPYYRYTCIEYYDIEKELNRSLRKRNEI